MSNQTTDIDSLPIETHPWLPFMPDGAKVLIMGTFPPQPKRWAMDFYYPNLTNDFWPMMGLIFFGSRRALQSADRRGFDLDKIKQLLCEKGIALHDTCHRIRRLMNNASDKYLDVVEPVDLQSLLKAMPHCHTIATTGEKASQIIAQLTGSDCPAMGQHVTTPQGLTHWRMPSTSRAYPLSLEKKAAYYHTLFRSIDLV